MTPFGQKIRELRLERHVTLKDMAKALSISEPYLSALEHGQRGKPTKILVHQICGYFNIIWDEAEELMALAEISHPKVTIDTKGMDVSRTLLANLLSKKIKNMEDSEISAMLEIIENTEKNK